MDGLFGRLLYILIGVNTQTTFLLGFRKVFGDHRREVFEASFKPSERTGFLVNINHIPPSIRR